LKSRKTVEDAARRWRTSKRVRALDGERWRVLSAALEGAMPRCPNDRTFVGGCWLRQVDGLKNAA